MAILFCIFLRQKRRKSVSKANLTSQEQEGSSEYMNTTRGNSLNERQFKRYSTAELPADVPMEVDATNVHRVELVAGDEKMHRAELPESTDTRVELAAGDEKMHRTELPASAAQEWPADVKMAPEQPQELSNPATHAPKTPRQSPKRSSVSPTSAKSPDSLVSPISPIR
jgi:hypothetical protein